MLADLAQHVVLSEVGFHACVMLLVEGLRLKKRMCDVIRSILMRFSKAVYGR